MLGLLVELSRFIIIIFMAIYTMQSYLVFGKQDDDEKEQLYLTQNLAMFLIHFICFAIMFLKTNNIDILFFFGAQFIYLAGTLIFYRNLYPRASKLLINHMSMLIMIGLVMNTRLDFDQAVRQFKMVVIATIAGLLVPIIIEKVSVLVNWKWLYSIMGIGLLGFVAVAAETTYGAKLGFSIAGFSVQPSEFVKIIFVFAIAGLLNDAKSFIDIVIATVIAALHVLILVYSTDLGSALIYFVTYLVMIYVGTRKFIYPFAGALAGSGAAVCAYHLFSHVQQRVTIWKDPFSDYAGTGYQIAQSLFAIAAGGWFGTGLMNGSPNSIPVVEMDFMFSAIAEELGIVFAILLILVCMNCYILFANIAMRLGNRFYRIVAMGLGTMYGIQVFLTIGGAIKLIPMTGVTLPLISYGGSSMLSTVLMFSIIQGLYILREDEEEKHAKKTRR